MRFYAFCTSWTQRIFVVTEIYRRATKSRVFLEKFPLKKGIRINIKSDTLKGKNSVFGLKLGSTNKRTSKVKTPLAFRSLGEPKAIWSCDLNDSSLPTASHPGRMTMVPFRGLLKK